MALESLLEPPLTTGYRNLLINGDMDIAQRTASSTGITGTGYYSLDRWRIGASATGTWTMAKVSDAPTGSGLRTCLKMSCTATKTTLDSGSYLMVQQLIEGKNIQNLKKGTANAQPLTLSFWVKSFQTGTFIIELYDYYSSRVISAEYTVSSSATWEYKTITFPADTAGIEIPNDTTAGFYAIWYLTAGSALSGGASLNKAWGVATTNTRAVGQTNAASSTSNYWQITGAQLEIGAVASPFEKLPITTNLALCQRYYYYEDFTQGAAIYNFIDGYNNAGYYINCMVTLPVPMRAVPTSTTFNAGATSNIASVGSAAMSNRSVMIWAYTTATGRAYYYLGNLAVDAELT